MGHVQPLEQSGLAVFMKGGGPGQICFPGSSGMMLVVTGTSNLVRFEAVPNEPDVRDFLW